MVPAALVYYEFEKNTVVDGFGYDIKSVEEKWFQLFPRIKVSGKELTGIFRITM